MDPFQIKFHDLFDQINMKSIHLKFPKIQISEKMPSRRIRTSFPECGIFICSKNYGILSEMGPYGSIWAHVKTGRSHMAPSSCNMSSYRAIWTHFRPNAIGTAAGAGASAQHSTGMTNWPNTIQCFGSDDIMSLGIKSSAFLRVEELNIKFMKLMEFCLK